MERYVRQIESDDDSTVDVEAYNVDWHYLLDEITGMHMFNHDAYDPRDVRLRYLKWWEDAKDSWPPESPCIKEGHH